MGLREVLDLTWVIAFFWIYFRHSGDVRDDVLVDYEVRVTTSSILKFVGSVSQKCS